MFLFSDGFHGITISGHKGLFLFKCTVCLMQFTLMGPGGPFLSLIVFCYVTYVIRELEVSGIHVDRRLAPVTQVALLEHIAFLPFIQLRSM